MTMTTHHTHHRRSPGAFRPHGALRPLGPRRGAHHRRLLGASARTSTATRPSPHIEHWLETEGWLANFDLAAAGTLPEGRRGREFSDSEVYKYLEASPGRSARPRRTTSALEARFRAVVARVAAAQEPDGYLNTKFGRPGQGPRWSDLEWGHELYCLGHLFQAAVARERTRPAPTTGCSRRTARRRPGLRGVRRGRHRSRSAATPRSRSGLAELGRVTGEPRYLDQAALFVERRGHGTLRRHRVGALVLPGRRAGARCDGAARARRAGQLPRRRRASTSPSRRATPTCSTRCAAQWDAHHRRAAPTSPAGRARTTRTRRSATTGSCRPTAPTPRPARASRRSCSAGGCCWPTERRALRRPHRAHAVQRRRDLAVGGGHGVLLRQHAAPARPDEARIAGRRSRRARRRRCARRGSRCRAARRTSRAPSRASPPTWRPRRRRRAAAPVRAGHHPHDARRRAASSSSPSTPTTRATADRGARRRRLRSAVDAVAARARVGDGAAARRCALARTVSSESRRDVAGLRHRDAGVPRRRRRRARAADAPRVHRAGRAHRRGPRLRGRRARPEVFALESVDLRGTPFPG